jgi:hypothetical protein
MTRPSVALHSISMSPISVTEFAILRLNNPHKWNHATTVEFFRKLSTEQASWSGYPLLYFRDVDVSDQEPQRIYLISGWKNVDAHHEWIASAQNQALLQEASELKLLDVVDLAHIAIEFETIPQDDRVLSVGRRPARGEVEQEEVAAEAEGWQRQGKALDNGMSEIWQMSDHGLESADFNSTLTLARARM